MNQNQFLQSLLKEDSSVERKTKNQRPSSAKGQDAFHISQLKKQVNTHYNFRPTSSKGNLDPYISKPMKSPSLNRERLYEENISLKMKANSLQEENLKLRTKINQIVKDLNKKEDLSEGIIPRSGSKTHLIPNLKQSIKDLKVQIKNKEDEIEVLKRNIKSTKMMEIDVEMQSYVDECTRLKHHLEEIMAQKQISYASLEYEEKLFRQNMDINSLREENLSYSQALNKAREEIALVKEKISLLENPVKKKKKSSGKKQELARLKLEIAQIRSKIDSDKEAFQETEDQLVKEAENLQRSNESVMIKIQATEIKLQEQNIVLEQLRSQIMNHEKDLKRSQTIDAPAFNFNFSKKLQNPPKLFRKIYHLILRKQMINDVFFSLMDKNSNGSIDIDEISKMMQLYGSKIKVKHIQEALNIIGAVGNSIPLSVIQEGYEKYDYRKVAESSSSEEIEEIAVSKKKAGEVERLNFVKVEDRLPEGVIVPEVGVPVRVAREIKKMVPAVRIEQVGGIVREITMKMRKEGLNKGKVLMKVFGDDFDRDLNVNAQKLAGVFDMCSLRLEDHERNYVFARFLVEPEGAVEVQENQMNDFKLDVLGICKRLLKLFEDWKVFSVTEISEAAKHLKALLTNHSEELIKLCSNLTNNSSDLIGFNEFKSISTKISPNIPTELWDKWEIALYPDSQVNYLEFLSIPQPIQNKSVKAIISSISKKLNTLQASPESLFTVSSEGQITAEDFIEGINKLSLDLTNDDLLSLLDSVSHHGSGNFSITVHINDLYKILSNSGFKLQTLSSSDDDQSNSFSKSSVIENS